MKKLILRWILISSTVFGIVFIVVANVAEIIKQSQTNIKNETLEQVFEISTVQYNKLFSIDRPELLAIYEFQYKNKKYLISSRGGIVEVK